MALTNARLWGITPEVARTREPSSMSMVKCRALTRIHGERIPGSYQNRGNTFECDRELAYELAGSNAVEILEASEAGDGGLPSSNSATNAAPPSLLPPGSPPVALTSSAAAVGPSSQSATVTGSAAPSKPSTRRTIGGGKSTPKKSGSRTITPRDGARTAKPAGTFTSGESSASQPPESVSDPATSTAAK